MAIGVRTVNAGLFGVASQTPSVNGSQLVGDMLILIGGGKPFDLGWSVATAGWTALGSAASGTTAAGVDTGSMKMQVWYKEALIDPEPNPTITEDTPVWDTAGGQVMIFSKAAEETWATPVVVYGADEVTGTAISVTYGSNPGVTTGDMICTACAINTDAMGPLTADLTPSQAGITFGTTTVRNNTVATTGGDMAYHVSTTPVVSGTGSAAPTATGTGTATGGADRLESAFIRLRVSVGGGPSAVARRTLLGVGV